MTRFSDLHAVSSGAGFPGTVGELPGDIHSSHEWVPPVLVDDAALMQFKIKRPAGDILPSISSKAMRLSLFRDYAARGRGNFDSLGVSIEWATAVLVYSAFNTFVQGGFEREMNVFVGYPQIFEYLPLRDRQDGEVYRIYARTAKTAQDIVDSAMLLASHRGYITESGAALNHFVDLTGIFITSPEVAPKRVGISGYEHWVDFEMDSSIPLLRFLDEPAYLIPGPARLSREELALAERVISGEAETDPEVEDVVELVRAFDTLPQFSIPIEVKGRGRLSEFPPRDLGSSSGVAASGPSLSASTMFITLPRTMGWQALGNPLMRGSLPMFLPRR